MADRPQGSLSPITNLAESAAGKGVEQSLYYLSTQLDTGPQKVGSIFFNIWSLQPFVTIWAEVFHPIVGKVSANGDEAATRWREQSSSVIEKVKVTPAGCSVDTHL